MAGAPGASPGPLSRGRPLLAALWSAALFAGGEIVLTLALGWRHPPAYYALCGLLTLTVAGLAGGAAALLRLAVPWAILGWVFAAGLLVYGPEAAIVLGVAALPPVRPARSGPGARGWLLGSCAALGMLLAFPRGEGVAHLTRLAGLLGPTGGEAVGLGVLFGLCYQVVPRVLVRWPRLARAGGGEGWPAILVAAAALLLAAKPFLSRPSGAHRLPRAADLETGVKVDRHSRPHVFLLVVDTLRADRLSVYGYERETTPELARLLAARPNAVVFPRAYANGTWTVPSHASLLTGLLPHEHGSHFALDGSVRFRFGLAEGTKTLAALLREQGYQTLGAFANNWLRIVHRLDEGFDRYLRASHSEPLPFVGEHVRLLLVPGIHPEARKTGARAHAVNQAILSMVEPWSKSGAPLFVFANYADTHGPYVPMPGFRGRFAPASPREEVEHLSILASPAEMEILQARYDEELLYADHQIGLLFAALERLGVLDEAWVFVTSDHGEAFGEHGVTEHGTAVYDEIVRVPLLVFPPAGETIPPAAGPVSLVDVAATIAGLSGADLAGAGGDLRRDPGDPGGVAIEFYGDRGKARRHGGLAAVPAVSVLRGDHKLIRRGADAYELYDLAADPGETRNLAPERPDLVEELKVLLPPWGEPTSLGAGAEPDEKTKSQLRDLGYVE
ncbi:MAG: sulfatase [Planctomycetota bacterium]